MKKKIEDKCTSLYAMYENDTKMCAIFFDKNDIRIEYDVKYTKLENIDNDEDIHSYSFEIDLEMFNCILAYLNKEEYKVEKIKNQPCEFHSFIYKRKRKQYEFIVDVNNHLFIINEIKTDMDCIYMPKKIIELLIVSLVKAGYKQAFIVEEK